MRDFRAQKDLVAVSANAKETAINTAQTLDTCLRVAVTDVANLTPRRETDVDELTGYEEPTLVYDLGNLSDMAVNCPKAQPQHFAILGAFGLGVCSNAALGDGYLHAITPLDGDVDADRSLPSMTLGMRYGDIVAKRRFVSMFVDALQATFSRDSWVSLAGTLKGTGKYDDNVVRESITAAPDAGTLTLAANAVGGATAAERLAAVHDIVAELESGEWTDVVFTAVSDATPAVISNAAPGEAGDDITYKVLYSPAASAWETFPAYVSETPLRVAQMTVKYGGAWDGSAFQGGRELTSELKSIEWALNNNMQIQFVPGAGDVYASAAFRDGRNQTLKLNREFRDYIMQMQIEENEYFGVYILCEGALFDDTYKYQVELIFPRCAVLSAPISVDGKRLAEAGDLVVLEDSTYGSVIMNVQNLVAAYAA